VPQADKARGPTYVVAQTRVALAEFALSVHQVHVLSGYGLVTVENARRSQVQEEGLRYPSESLTRALLPFPTPRGTRTSSLALF